MLERYDNDDVQTSYPILDGAVDVAVKSVELLDGEDRPALVVWFSTLTDCQDVDGQPVDHGYTFPHRVNLEPTARKDDESPVAYANRVERTEKAISATLKRFKAACLGFNAGVSAEEKAFNALPADERALEPLARWTDRRLVLLCRGQLRDGVMRQNIDKFLPVK